MLHILPKLVVRFALLGRQKSILGAFWPTVPTPGRKRSDRHEPSPYAACGETHFDQRPTHTRKTAQILEDEIE